jgi:hypothetical protein
MSEHESGQGGGNSGSGGGNPGQGGAGNPGQGGGGNPGPGGGQQVAHIIVDSPPPKIVREGDWLVSALKQEVGVDPAKVLAEIIPSGLKDLEDTAHINVKDGMRFMSHARKGAAS